MNDQLVVLPEKLQGWYKIEKFLGPQEDGILLETYEFPNLIVNSGLDFMCTTNGPWGTSSGGFYRCSVGTNNTAPAAGQTLLLGGVGSTITKVDLGHTYVPGATPYVQRAVQYDFAVGDIVANIAEIGIGPGTYAVTSLMSRALVLDGGGSPTVVSVLVTESLRVTYYLRNYIVTTDTAGVVTIGGINYNYVVRAAGWNNLTWTGTGVPFPGGWNSNTGGTDAGGVFTGHNLTSAGVTGTGVLGAFSTQTLATIDLLPAVTGGAVGCGTAAPQTYTSGDYYRDSIITIGLTEANTLTGGIGSIVYGGYFGLYQMSFTPQLPKTALNAFALRLRISLSNYP